MLQNPLLSSATLIAAAALFSAPPRALADASPSALEPQDAAPFYGSVTVGYDSSYVYRGGSFGDDAPWSEVDLNIDVTDDFTLNFGAWYINPTRNASVNDELDFYGYLSYSFESPRTGAWEVAVGGAWSGYLEDDSDETEAGVTVTKSLGDWFDLVFEYVYDFTYKGHYFGYSAVKCIPLCERLDLDLTAGISHGDDHYNYDVVGGDHGWLRAETTFHLTDSVEIGAYLLQNCPYNDLASAGEESDLYGGGSLTVSF